MKFPITRKCLQEFDYNKEQEEIKAEEIQKQLALLIEQICRDFKQNMLSNSVEKKFVWRHLGNIPHHFTQSSRINTKTDYLQEFIEKLKEIFIDCDIIIDPLKTYLIIDWS